jgi:hypothetical protein
VNFRSPCMDISPTDRCNGNVVPSAPMERFLMRKPAVVASAVLWQFSPNKLGKDPQSTWNF